MGDRKGWLKEVEKLRFWGKNHCDFETLFSRSSLGCLSVIRGKVKEREKLRKSAFKKAPHEIGDNRQIGTGECPNVIGEIINKEGEGVPDEMRG